MKNIRQFSHLAHLARLSVSFSLTNANKVTEEIRAAAFDVGYDSGSSSSYDARDLISRYPMARNRRSRKKVNLSFSVFFFFSISSNGQSAVVSTLRIICSRREMDQLASNTSSAMCWMFSVAACVHVPA